MQSYERETRVSGSFDEVWDFHSRISGLTALTPDWMGMEIAEIRNPNGERAPELRRPNPGILEVGCEIDVTVQPFGVGPKQSWTSEIIAREERGGAAVFRDEMSEGPFDRWTHSHYFYADGRGTKVRDHVDYRLPFGFAGQAAGPFAIVGFEPMFRYRHTETERLLGD